MATPEELEAWRQAQPLTLELDPRRARRLHNAAVRDVRRWRRRRRRERMRALDRRVRELRALMMPPEIRRSRAELLHAARGRCAGDALPVRRRTGARRRGAGRPRAAASRSSARSGDGGDGSGSSDGESSSAHLPRPSLAALSCERAGR